MVSSRTKYWVSMHLSMHLTPFSLTGHSMNSNDRTGTFYWWLQEYLTCGARGSVHQVWLFFQLGAKDGSRDVSDAKIERPSRFEFSQLTISALKLVSFGATSISTLTVRLSTFKARVYAH